MKKWIIAVIITILLIAMFYQLLNPMIYPSKVNSPPVENNNSSKEVIQSQWAEANNTQRYSDVNTILNAVNQYNADKKGVPNVITGNEQEISKSQIDLCSFLVPDYTMFLPIDPKITKRTPSVKDCNSDYLTGYMISKNPSNNKITVKAPNAELGEKIEVTR